ncbi:sugar phosphate isomerase/epimerase [Verminephrobacter aporrectodeae subsp. tuberculatae]|uniref:sugar phosphate isomerase/epimerase family protein n=1 Tax=Verminephrobacter aporrectodeae TaxID=1110389 RepID=UPI00224367F5|nr:sugar phosphate isomerase/epimerase [Verminephrobacter aporrectodeae]MCW8197574.1 sugar phosphate isomerase/epimerase [Verminephrobacter aporrectodeae subsp. tuberculatae]
MNPLGIHALVWAGDLGPESTRRVISQTRRAGYDLIELSLHGSQLMDLALTRDLLQEHGLQVGCSRGLTFAADVSSEDPHVVARGVALLEEGVSITHALGGHYFGGILYGAMAKYAHPCTMQGRRNAVAAVKRVAAFAGERGVTLGLEVVNRYESNLLNTATQALAMIDAVGAPNVKVHLDTYHMNIEEVDFMQPVLACREQLGYVHIGESHRGYLGSGTIDFAQFFKALALIDYQGVVTFESFSSTVVNEELSNALAIWRNLWGDGMDLALHAHGFMVQGLHAARMGLAHCAPAK